MGITKEQYDELLKPVPFDPNATSGRQTYNDDEATRAFFKRIHDYSGGEELMPDTTSDGGGSTYSGRYILGSGGISAINPGLRDSSPGAINYDQATGEYWTPNTNLIPRKHSLLQQLGPLLMLAPVGLALAGVGAAGAAAAGAGAAGAGAAGAGAAGAAAAGMTAAEAAAALGTAEAALGAGTAVTAAEMTAMQELMALGMTQTEAAVALGITPTGGSLVGSAGYLGSTGSALGDAAANAALKGSMMGAGTSAVTGGDPLQGAMYGALGGGLSGAMGSFIPSMDTGFGSTANAAANSAIKGGLSSAIMGKDPVTGAAMSGLTGGVGSELKSAGLEDVSPLVNAGLKYALTPTPQPQTRPVRLSMAKNPYMTR